MKQTNTVKFQIQELLGIGMSLVVLGIGLAYGMQIIGDVRDDKATADCAGYPPTHANYTTYNAATGRCTDGVATGSIPVSPQYNGTAQSLDAVAKIPEKLGTVVTVIIAAVIIGVLITYLYSRFQ